MISMTPAVGYTDRQTDYPSPPQVSRDEGGASSQPHYLTGGQTIRVAETRLEALSLDHLLLNYQETTTLANYSVRLFFYLFHNGRACASREWGAGPEGDAGALGAAVRLADVLIRLRVATAMDKKR